MTIAPPPANPTSPQPQAGLPIAAAAPNLPRAVIFGAIAAVIGALVWGGITYATNVQIGWMAIGVGFLAGIAVRTGSQGGAGRSSA